MPHHEQPDANENAPLTTAAGAPVVDNQNSITAGPRGPVLMQDLWLIEKLAHFAREVIPERRMHANGSGAFGTFTVTNDISRYTRAALFNRVGNSCEVVARFSTVAGERGAADAERDIRGFAVRFFTTEGNWDVVGNNTPVFFFRDPLNRPPSHQPTSYRASPTALTRCSRADSSPTATLPATGSGSTTTRSLSTSPAQPAP